MANGGGAKDDAQDAKDDQDAQDAMGAVDAVGDLRSGAAEANGTTGANLPRSTTLSSPTDQLNRAIVRLLQDDGRLPFKTIASKLGVSEGTVRNRVGWMTRAGMLRIVAVADPTAMNYRADAMLGVKVAPASSPAKVAERLAVHPEVVYILWVSGRFDLLVEIVCESDEAFLDFLSQHCFDHDDIASLEVMTGLAMYKNQFLLKQDFA